MMKFRCCILITGLGVLLLATGPAQGMWQGRQVLANVACTRDLALDESGTLVEGCTGAETEEATVWYSPSQRVRSAVTDSPVVDDIPTIAVHSGQHSKFGGYGSGTSVLNNEEALSRIAGGSATDLAFTLFDSTTTAVNTDNGCSDLVITKTGMPSPVVAGGPLTYTLVVTNSSSVTTTGVIVTDSLPSGVSFRSATPSKGACDGTHIVTCTLGTLIASETATIEISTTVAPSARGTLINIAKVSADQPDLTPHNNTYTETTTADAEADIVVTKTDQPDPVIAGETLSYTLIVTNNGPSEATGVTVTDTLPPGITFDSASSSQGSYDRDTGLWTVGRLADGASATVTLVLTVDPSTRGRLPNIAEMSATEPDPTPSDHTATAVTTVNAEADLILTKTDAPDPVTAGQTLTYTLIVTNSGPSEATSVIVTDTLPSGIVVDLATSSQGTYTGDNGVWTVGRLANGASATLTLVLTVAPSTRGWLPNIAEMSAIEPDPTPGDNMATAVTTVNAEADLILTKTDAPDPVIAGQTLTYTLIVTNSGPSDTGGVRVIDDLPDAVTLFSAMPSQGACSGFDPVTCDIGSIAAGANASVSLVVTVTRPLTNGMALINLATISGDETDPYPGNNSVHVQTTVQSSPVLTITKAGFPDEVEPNGILRYTIIITNSGNENAAPVTVTEHYDPYLSFVWSEPLPSNWPSGDRTWIFESLDVDQPEMINIFTKAADIIPSGTVLTNQATLESGQIAPITATETTTVTSFPTFIFYKYDLSEEADAGTNLEYIIHYGNYGNSPAHDVVITETYDSRVTLVSAVPDPENETQNMWEFPEVGVGEAGDIRVTVWVTTPLPNNTVLTNRVTIDSRDTSPWTTAETTTVRSDPNLVFIIIDDPDPVEADTPLTYTLRYTNTGNAHATQVVITAILDSRVSLDSATPPPSGGGAPEWYWNVGTIAGEGGSGEIVIRANAPCPISNDANLEFRAQLEYAEGNPLERLAQTKVHSLPDLIIEKVAEGHKPNLFSPGEQMAYIVTYRNAGCEDAQNVIITTTLPAGTRYEEVGHPWQPYGDGTYVYAVGPLTATSTWHTITFTVRHADTPEISAHEFNTPFTIAARGAITEDVNTGDNTTFVHIGVPDLLISDFRVKPDPTSVQANEPTTFTFTVTLMNQGTGMACSPDDPGVFYVDVFTAPVASFPYHCDGIISKACDSIGAGCQPSPLVITRVITSSRPNLTFYVKADNHCRHPYGLIPEFDEMNNIAAWPPRVFLPIVLREYHGWDIYFEDNDHWLDAYGPLTPGQAYQAYPDDENDYYYIELSTPSTVTVTAENFAPTSSYGNLLLYGPASGDERGVLRAQFGKSGHSSMHLEKSLGPGKYYVRVHTAKAFSTTSLYRLTWGTDPKVQSRVGISVH